MVSATPVSSIIQHIVLQMDVFISLRFMSEGRSPRPDHKHLACHQREVVVHGGHHSVWE